MNPCSTNNWLIDGFVHNQPNLYNKKQSVKTRIVNRVFTDYVLKKLQPAYVAYLATPEIRLFVPPRGEVSQGAFLKEPVYLTFDSIDDLRILSLALPLSITSFSACRYSDN